MSRSSRRDIQAKRRRSRRHKAWERANPYLPAYGMRGKPRLLVIDHKDVKPVALKTVTGDFGEYGMVFGNLPDELRTAELRPTAVIYSEPAVPKSPEEQGAARQRASELVDHIRRTGHLP